MRKHRTPAVLTALITAAAALPVLHANAVNGAGGYTWEKTSGYQEATTAVTDSDGTTTVTFENATDGQEGEIAGFCAQNGDGWDWSDYTELSFKVTNNCTTAVGFGLALGTGADWSWHQANSGATIDAGTSSVLTYYLKGEEWTYDGTVCAVADLYQTHRINMMVMAPYQQSPVSGSVTISDLKLSGSGSVAVEPKDGFYVDGTVLRDANKNPFIMRGTNYAYTWYKQDDYKAAFKEIAAYGGNAVRIVLADGVQWTKTSAGEVEALIQACEDAKLVCILEPHDATGNNNTDALLTAARYYADDLAAKLKGHENTVIINIANEWMAASNDSQWQSAYIDAVKIIRDAGLKHCIMCDAGGYGQGASTMINGGKAVLEADPEHNCMFSIHMYGTAGGNSATIKNTFDSMITRQLCFCVGEFGWNHSDGDVDEEYIMQYAQETGTGWLAWSWYGNGGGVEYLDMSSANVGGTLSSNWGANVVSGTYGWKATTKVCSVYDSAAVSTETTTTTTTTHTTSTETTTTTTTTHTTSTETTTTTTHTTSTETTTVSTAAGTPVWGDADCSGAFELSDAVLLAKASAGISGNDLSVKGKANCDLNADGNADGNDLRIALMMLAGIYQNSDIPVRK